MSSQKYQHILVPVDGSKGAQLAFEKAVEISYRNGQKTELQLLQVIDTRNLQNIPSLDYSITEQITKTAQHLLDKYVKYAHEHGTNNVVCEIEEGNPKLLIAREIPTKLNTDLIVIGATGLNTMEQFLIGSVTAYVTRTAACDVMVVRSDLQNKSDSLSKSN